MIYLMIYQKVVIHIESVEPFVTGITIESKKINVLICTKSSDQGLLQTGGQAACRRVRLSKTSIYNAFC